MPLIEVPAGVKFGRSKVKSRVPIFFTFTTDSLDDVPKRYKYKASTDDWEQSSVAGFSSRLLDTTVQSLGLTEAKYKSFAKGTGSGSKVWKIVASVTASTVERLGAGAPTGRPAKVTTFNIPVPSWLSVFLFAHSVYSAIKTENAVYNASSGDSPAPGAILRCISPSGISYSPAALQRILDASEPPDPGSPGLIEV